jgi:hypothetical protein
LGVVNDQARLVESGMKEPDEVPDDSEEAPRSLPVEVTLVGDQVAVCRMALLHRLDEVSGRLSAGLAADGCKMPIHIKKSFMEESARLQLALLHFGYTSAELENLVKNRVK